MIKALNLGCGRNFEISTPEVQWINIDVIKEFKADLYHDLREPLPFESESIDIIKGKDILEHFLRDTIPVVFKDWVRVLKVGGKLEVIVPNYDAIKGFNGNLFLNLMFGEQMFAHVNTHEFGTHKWSFNRDSLSMLFVDNGLKIITIQTCDGTNLLGKGEKI